MQSVLQLMVRTSPHLSTHPLFLEYIDHPIDRGCLSSSEFSSLLFLLWLPTPMILVSLFDLIPIPYFAYITLIRGDRRRVHHLGQCRGRGKPPNTLDDTSIATLFDHNIHDCIHRKVMSMQEEDIYHKDKQ